MSAKNKSCLVFETLGKVTDMEMLESKDDKVVRLHGVFGVCGVKNGNNRVYSKENYGKMVENLQHVIATDGVLGELEHPNTMNINLDNVSHMIESIEMDDNGVITGTIRLLDTVKGNNAKAIVEAGCPLFISSRGAGSIDESGNVTLSTIKTYDLVGTPGFSQAKLTLKESQTLECLNESLAIIYESDDEDDLLDTDDSSDDEKKEESSEEKEENKESEEDKKDEKKEDEEKEDKEDNNKDNNNKVTMEEIKNAIDKLSEKVTSLEAELHVAQESLKNVKPINYEAIETWVKEEFANEFRSDIEEAILESVDDKISESQEAVAEGVTRWMAEEYTPKLEDYINEEYSKTIQDWITEEYSPMVEKWISEEYSSKIDEWVNEELMTETRRYVNEEYTQHLQDWINEEFIPAQKEEILNEAYKNVNAFIESKKDDRLAQIDKMLESIDAIGNNSAVQQIVEEEKKASKFKGIFVVENMPSQYEPLWNGISEAKQNEIIRSSRMYDFTKSGVLESFWANVDFNEAPVNESKNLAPDTNSYYEAVAARMRSLMH